MPEEKMTQEIPSQPLVLLPYPDIIKNGGLNLMMQAFKVYMDIVIHYCCLNKC